MVMAGIPKLLLFDKLVMDMADVELFWMIMVGCCVVVVVQHGTFRLDRWYDEPGKPGEMRRTL